MQAPADHRAEKGYLDHLTELADGSLQAFEGDPPVDWPRTTLGACAAGDLVFAIDGDDSGIQAGRLWMLMRVE